MHNLHPCPDTVNKDLHVSDTGFFKTQQKPNFALFLAPLQRSGRSVCHKSIDMKAFRYHRSQHCENTLHFTGFL